MSVFTATVSPLATPRRPVRRAGAAALPPRSPSPRRSPFHLKHISNPTVPRLPTSMPVDRIRTQCKAVSAAWGTAWPGARSASGRRPTGSGGVKKKDRENESNPLPVGARGGPAGGGRAVTGDTPPAAARGPCPVVTSDTRVVPNQAPHIIYVHVLLLCQESALTQAGS